MDARALLEGSVSLSFARPTVTCMHASIQTDRHRQITLSTTRHQPLSLLYKQAFLSAVVRDEAYLTKTWEVTTPWNKALRAELATRFPGWKVGAGFCLAVFVCWAFGGGVWRDCP